MKDIGLVIAVAVLVEAIVETLKPVWDKEKGWNTTALIALAVSVLACVLSGADLFAFVGAPLSVPYVGAVLTGIIASRGANFIHDIWPKISGILSFTPVLSNTDVPTTPPAGGPAGQYRGTKRPPFG